MTSNGRAQRLSMGSLADASQYPSASARAAQLRPTFSQGSDDGNYDPYPGHTTPTPNNQVRGMAQGLQPRVRSSTAVSALDTSGCCGASNQTSPENSPMSAMPWSRDQASAAADAYVSVHVRRPSYGKLNTHRPPSGSLLRSFPPLHRKLMLFVLGGLVVGCMLHGFVLWRGIALHAGPYAPASHGGGFSTANMDGLPTRESGDEHGNRVITMTPTAKPKMTLEEAQKLGMPGDSDRLPDQPVWDASRWNYTEKINPDSDRWPNSIAICAIMKGEHPDDVVQWLKYHMYPPRRWLGVDKVFVRENAATLPRNLMPRVQGMIDSGFLDIGTLPGPKHPLQNRWYNRCSKPDMAGEHSWVTFLDLDEFMVVLEKGVASKTPNLKAVLDTYKGNAGLSLQWVLFGSSGLMKRPKPGGPLAHFHKCTGYLSFQMKCMANMYHATHHMMVGNTVHDCTYKLEDYSNVQNPPVTLTDGTPLHLYKNTDMTNPNYDAALGDSRTYRGHLDSETYNSTITHDHRLVLFHYVTRSLEDYTSRKINLPAGIFANKYVQKYGKQKHLDLKDGTVMADFEHANDFDGTAAICSSAQKAFYAGHCCSGSM